MLIVIESPKDISASAGGMVVFHCKIQDAFAINWYLNNSGYQSFNDLDAHAPMNATIQPTESNLTINNVPFNSNNTMVKCQGLESLVSSNNVNSSAALLMVQG